MANKIEILVNEPALMNRKIDKNIDIQEFKDELEAINTEYDVDSTNIGPGADWILLLISVTVSLFLLGEKINKNLDAWIDLSKKFKKLLNKIKHKKFFIDSNGATLVALNDLLKKNEIIENIDLVHSYELSNHPMKSFFMDERPPARIDSKPYRFFVKIFLVNDRLFHIYGVKSNGEIKFYQIFTDEHSEFSNY